MKRKSIGSVQVVEMSFVLPIAMLVVLSLIYLAFAMFLYVHVNNIALIYVDKLGEQVGQDGMYWQLLGNYIDEDSLNATQQELESQLKSCAILPGLKFDSSCSVTGKNHCPKSNVYISASYFGKQIFKVSANKDVYKPYEFTNMVDFGYSLEDDFKELKDIYDKFF